MYMYCLLVWQLAYTYNLNVDVHVPVRDLCTCIFLVDLILPNGLNVVKFRYVTAMYVHAFFGTHDVQNGDVRGTFALCVYTLYITHIIDSWEKMAYV